MKATWQHALTGIVMCFLPAAWLAIWLLRKAAQECREHEEPDRSLLDTPCDDEGEIGGF